VDGDGDGLVEVAVDVVGRVVAAEEAAGLLSTAQAVTAQAVTSSSSARVVAVRIIQITPSGFQELRRATLR
jgi:hypothetical protein